MKILITGAAGFVGFHTARRLLGLGHEVVGVDNLNDYYDVRLKEARLAQLAGTPGFSFFKLDLADRDGVSRLFMNNSFDAVVHLGAQAGVRYSLENPFAYTDSNVTGTLSILEGCRSSGIGDLVYASSSSVYGANTKQPFSTSDRVDSPISLYAATKKANEMMCYAYAHLYGIRITGLRFFTVYGPWGRPDMAYFKFAEAILSGKPIDVYNNGDMSRDFTYIDDIVDGIQTLVCAPPQFGAGAPPHRVYNLGNNRPERLLDMIAMLEVALGKTATKNFLPMQPGDVHSTYADIAASSADFGYAPRTNLEEGLARFAKWFVEYRSSGSKGGANGSAH